MSHNCTRARLYAEATALKRPDGTFTDGARFDDLMQQIDAIDAHGSHSERSNVNNPKKGTATMESELLERAEAVDWCRSRGIILRGSVAVSTENQWRSVLGYASEVELATLTGHVRAAEIQQARDAAWEQDFDRAREAREQPMGEAEQAAVNQELIEATVRAQDAQRPATREQVDRLIRINERIAAALEKR
jgi:hypothetical protein